MAWTLRLKARVVVLICRAALGLGGDGERGEALRALIRNYSFLIRVLNGEEPCSQLRRGAGGMGELESKPGVRERGVE